MQSFSEWGAKLDKQISEASFQQQNDEVGTNNEGPNDKWDQLINDHRVKFTSKFVESSLTIDDKQFVVTFFDTFKYSKQKPAGHIFETKIKAVTFQIAYFGKQQWAAALSNSKTREVTELFTITQMKIKSMFNLFEKAINQQSFKDILPVKVK